MTDKFYVAMTDKFMSGWGPAKGSTAKFVIECDTLEQAEAIKKAADDRPEMKYVNIHTDKPYYRPGACVTHRHFNDLGAVWKQYYRPIPVDTAPAA